MFSTRALFGTKTVPFIFALVFLTAAYSPATADGTAGPGYILGPDDIIEVAVANHPDLDKIITILPDGRITFTRAGELRAAGKTARSLAVEIQQRLEQSLNNCEVTISVKEVHSQRARVVGAVKLAGIYDLKPKWRLMDLVALAGGLTVKPTRITGRVIRAGAVIPFDTQHAVLNPDSADNLLLQADDLVVLDEQDVHNQIHVIGQVTKPGAFDLDEGLTVVSLVAEAGGVADGAALSKAYVLRNAAQIPLDLQAVLVDGKKDDLVNRFQFQPGDVLVVPQNEARFGVMGQVTKPGYFPLPEKKSEATVLKALALAGGQLPDGDLHTAGITRMVDGKSTEIPVDIEGMLRGATADDITLQPEDVLYIPQAHNQVHVIGRVGKPGVFELHQGLTLMTLISEAGNPIDGAALSKSYILRDGAQIPVNLYAMLVEGKRDENAANLKLQAGDVLVIPDAHNQIHVIGQVAKPGGYDLDDGLTVASLISEAGSSTSQAAMSKAYVQREGLEIPLNLQSILAGSGKADENVAKFKFQPGDVLVIPDTHNQIHVIGQVAKPAAYDLSDGLSVVSLISEAGSPTPDAALSKTYVLRGGAQIPLDLHGLLDEGNANPTVANFKFQPGDVLVVPENTQRFGVMGQVLKPGYYPVPEKKGEATVLKALGAAGGQGPEGDLRKAGIVRIVNGKPTVLPVDIEDILKKGNLANNVELQPDDILYIPPRHKGFSWTDLLAPLSTLGYLGLRFP